MLYCCDQSTMPHHQVASTSNPVILPSEDKMACLQPWCMALWMDSMTAGPGVNEAASAKLMNSK